MKHIIIIKIVLVIIFFSGKVSGQTYRDSLVRSSVKILQKKINFSENTSRLLQVAVQKRTHRTDSLNRNYSLTVDDRKKELRNIWDKYREEVKSLLTVQQWLQYQQLETATRDSFLIRMKDKKIPISELGQL